MEVKNILVTGASGKIGRNLVPALLKAGYKVRAVECNTPLKFEKVEVVKGKVEDEKFINKALEGMDAVCHLATCKEDRERFIDVSIRGTFNLLDLGVKHKIKQFILASGDGAIGIFFYPHPIPLDENAPIIAYPGYYAFSKAMEEFMCAQYAGQYKLPTTILRFSWIFENDDILNHMALKQTFGAPEWKDLAETSGQKKYFEQNKEGVGCLLHADAKPFSRHIVGIDDVVQAFMLAIGNDKAINETFNIAAPSAFSYDVAAKYISEKLNCPIVEFKCNKYYDFSINISKARSILGYKPEIDIFKIIDKAIEFRRSGKAGNAAKYNG